MSSSRRTCCRTLAFALALCATLSAPAKSSAGLIINCLSAVPAGAAPDMTGGGNLGDIMNAAAAYWMAAFPNTDWTLDVTYQWGGVVDSYRAQFRDPVYSAGHIAAGNIFFNNTTMAWYADPVPQNIVSPAFGPLTRTSVDYNGHQLVTGLAWDALAGGPAYDRLDLLTIAKHELGHALGLYAPPATVPEIVVGADIYPEFAGFGMRLDGLLDHLDDPITAIMASGFHQPDGLRKGISAADILAVAQLNGWANPNLNPYPVPEPSSLALLTLGVVLLASARARTKVRAS